MGSYFTIFLVQAIILSAAFSKKKVRPIIFILAGLCNLLSAFLWSSAKDFASEILYIAGSIWILYGIWGVFNQKTANDVDIVG